MSRRSVNSRESAYEALLAVERDGRQSHLVVRDFLENMKGDASERAFFRRLVIGTIEYRIQLDDLLNHVSRTPVRKMKPQIRTILRMAVFQILHMDAVPHHAAVSEAVKLTVSKGFSGLRSFVNGVLRNALREIEKGSWPSESGSPEKDLSVSVSVPEETVRIWSKAYGPEKTEAICRAFLEERPLCVHVREGVKFETLSAQNERNCPAEISEEMSCTDHAAGDVHADGAAENRQADLHKKFIPGNTVSGAFFLPPGIRPDSLEEFRKGEIWVQDLSSQKAVLAAGIQPDDRVLDLCAAPGGKTMLA
ncbi:MAG: hypothetical protein HUJ73_02645, partial [Eubacterium sp.]|nr:hypothetical protein [Eubacterium sp.]